jgi:DNA-binding MarR family transcriptional regulator
VVSHFRHPALPHRPLTAAQQRALVALVEVCGELGSEGDPAAIAAHSGMQAGGVTLALGGLERRGLVAGHGEHRRSWSPTLTGRALARSLRAEADPAVAEQERRVERPEAP